MVLENVVQYVVEEVGLRVVLTHVVEAVRFSCFGTHEGNIRPLAIAVGVTLNQVVGRLSIPDPVT